MTTKDLNLSLDQGLLRPQNPRKKVSPGHHADKKARDSESRATSRSQSRRSASRTRSHSYVPAVLGAALANILILVLTGLWFIETTDILVTSQSVGDERIASTQSKIEDQLTAIERELASLRLVVGQQQHLVVLAFQQIEEQLRPIPTPLSPPASETPDEAIATANPVQLDKEWNVNLGNFAARETAIELQRQVKTLGHESQIRTAETDGKTNFTVVLPGFLNQEAADLAAAKLMDKTALTSLWVRQDD